MQFLADENFPYESISLLIAQGFQVRKAAMAYQGKPDIFLFRRGRCPHRPPKKSYLPTI